MSLCHDASTFDMQNIGFIFGFSASAIRSYRKPNSTGYFKISVSAATRCGCQDVVSMMAAFREDTNRYKPSS